MAYVRSHKFCCCLPVRFGVFVLSLLSLFLGGLLGVGGVVAIKQQRDGKIDLDKGEKISLYIQTALFIIIAFISLFGFIGTLSRNRRMVSIYSTMTWGILFFSITTGTVSLIHTFRNAKQTTEDNTEDCKKAAKAEDGSIADDICKGGSKAITTATKAITVTLFVIFWLITLYLCLIVQSYVAQLEEEEASEIPSGAPVNVTVMNTAPVPIHSAYDYGAPPPGAAPQMSQQYAFSQPQNSYGQDAYGKV